MSTPAAEWPIDAVLARALLQEQHPDLAALPIELLDEGWDNVMFRLGDAYALRLPRRAMAAGLIEAEQRWLGMLAPSLPLPTPAPVRLGRPGPHYPWAWSVLPWIEGVAADLQPPADAQALRLVAFLQALHQPAPPDAPRNPVRGVPLAVRQAVMSQRCQRLQEAGLLPEGVLDAWVDAVAAPVAEQDTWFHGDLHSRNVLVHEGQLSGVIDWSDMGAGDGAVDLASVWMLFDSLDAREHAMAAYNTSPALLRRARGWALLLGVMLLDSGRVDHPRHAAMGRDTLRRVLQGP